MIKFTPSPPTKKKRKEIIKTKQRRIEIFNKIKNYRSLSETDNMFCDYEILIYFQSLKMTTEFTVMNNMCVQ